MSFKQKKFQISTNTDKNIAKMVLWTFPILPSNPPLGQQPRDKTREEVLKPILHQYPVTGWPVLLIITGIDAPISTLIKYRVAKAIFNYCRHQDSNTGPTRVCVCCFTNYTTVSLWGLMLFWYLYHK